MMKRLLSRLSLTAALLLGGGTLSVYGQDDVESYKFDFGAGIGMSGYLGDANESNLFKHPGLDANLSFRYLANSRFAVRALLSVATLSGNSAEMSNVFPDGAVYDFKSTVFDLGARAEFNFFAYGIGETYKRLRRWTPYLTLGVGAALSSCDGTTAVALTLPMGAGVKFKVSRRVNLAAEFTMTKLFGDKADGIQDPYKIKSSFFKNTDWMSALTISFSYEFGPRCVVCHRVD